ncbi:MAG: protease modulator HflC [Rhodospirillaceae bacterium]|nr:protease modulator HflC [Rhodospirillaceae bacterium]
MSSPKIIILGIIAAAIGVSLSSALFTVEQTQQAIVMQFGDPKRVIREAGLHVKVPFVQDAVYYDKRVLDLDPPTEEVILADRKRIMVDAFARYKIVDPLRFFQAVRTEAIFRDRVGKILNSGVRNALARYPLVDVLSSKREEIMASITSIMTEDAQNFGIEVVDVRIGRTDLPPDISDNVYDRMRSEREREANQLRAEGEELKIKIVADADKQKTILLADANRTAKILVGEGDGERNRILGDAFGQDPEFFAFYRSMKAYRSALTGSDTSMVLSPDSDFFRFFGNQLGKQGAKR